MTLSKEYEDLRATVADFARTVVAPVSAKHDEEHSFPYQVVAKMGEMGLFGLPFPEEYGGMGGDYFALALALEELGRVDQSVAITLEAGVGLGAMPIFKFGSDEQKMKFLPKMAAGELVGCFGLTEADGGSDPASMKTTAVAVDGGYRLNGGKYWITNSPISDLAVVWANLDGTIRGFIVERGFEGFTNAKAHSVNTQVRAARRTKKLRQPHADAIAPPTVGPILGAKPMATPAMPMAVA